MNSLLPDFVTPEQLAHHFGWSAREVRRKAPEIGSYRIVGNAVIMLKEDVDAFLDAVKPSVSEYRQSRTSALQLVQGTDYSDLVRLKEKIKRERMKGKA